MSSSADLASLVAQAREALVARHLDTAIEAAGRALKVEPRCVDAYLVRAEAQRRTNKYERALADLAVAVRLAPDRPGPYIVRAEILRRRNVFDQAIADATHALILDPRNASAFSIRAQCRHAVGDREGADDDVRAMLEIDPTRSVPNRPDVPSVPSPAAILDERFWKEPGDGRRPDDPTLFADGKPVDRTYRSRRAVADEDAPEELGAASGYRPEVVLAPLPRTRTVRRRSLSRNGGLATLAFGVLLGAAGVFWALHRTAEPVAARTKSPSPASVSAGPKVDAGSASAAEDSERQVPPAPDEIDLLQMVDLSRALTGAWGQRDRALAVTPDGARPAVMTFSQTVVDEYDLEVRAEPDEPGLILVGLAHGGRRFAVGLAPEIGNYWLQQFSDPSRRAAESRRRGPVFGPGETPTFRIGVRNDGVVVSSRGERLIDWKGDFSEFTDRPLAQVKLPDAPGLFLASWTPARFTLFRLIPLAEAAPASSPPGSTAERLSPAVGEDPAPPHARTTSKTIDLAIGADGSGEFLAGDRGDGRDGPADAPRSAAAGLKIEGLKDAEIERLPDGRYRIVHDFRKVREFVSAATLSKPAGRLEVDPRQGSLVLTPAQAPNEDFKLARLEYPRQLRLPLTIRCTIEDFLEDGLIGVNAYWPSSVFAVNLHGRADDGASPRSLDGSWRLDRSRPDERNGVFDPHDAGRPGAKQLFRLPLTGAHAEDRIAPAIGVRTAVESKGVLKIRRIEVVARIVGRLGVGFDQRDGEVVVKQVLEGAGARAGVRPGDVVAKLGDREPGSIQNVMRLLSAVSVGDTIRLTVLRDGKPTELPMVAE